MSVSCCRGRLINFPQVEAQDFSDPNVTWIFAVCKSKRRNPVGTKALVAPVGDSCTGILMQEYSYKHAFNTAVNYA